MNDPKSDLEVGSWEDRVKVRVYSRPHGGGVLQQDVAGQPAAPELPQALAVAQHVQNALEALVHLDLRQVSNVFFHHKIVP